MVWFSIHTLYAMAYSIRGYDMLFDMRMLNAYRLTQNIHLLEILLAYMQVP